MKFESYFLNIKERKSDRICARILKHHGWIDVELVLVVGQKWMLLVTGIGGGKARAS